MRAATENRKDVKKRQSKSFSKSKNRSEHSIQSQTGASKGLATESGKKKKKAMPPDGSTALAVLQRVVDAEEQLRAENGASVGDPEQVVAEAAKGSMTGQEQFAILSQLAGNTIMHQQVGALYQKSAVEQQAEQLRRRRLSGFCCDAQKLGYSLAEAYASEDGGQAQEVLLACLGELQEKMVQTEDTVTALCGEDERDNRLRKQRSRSTILLYMLTAVCSRDHLTGEKLFRQIGTTLMEKDAASVSSILSQRRVCAAYSTLVECDDDEERGKQLCDVKGRLAHASPQELGLSCQEFTRVKELLHIDIARQGQIDNHVKVIRQRHLLNEYCSCVMEGDRAGAYRLVQGADTLTSSDRRKLTQALTCTQWDTSVSRFVGELSRVVMQRSSIEWGLAMPDREFSPFDLSLLLDLTATYSPEIQFENELVVVLVTQVAAESMADKTEHHNSASHPQVLQGGLSQSFSKLSAIRYIINGVLLCRQKNDCVYSFLEKAKKHIAFTNI